MLMVFIKKQSRFYNDKLSYDAKNVKNNYLVLGSYNLFISLLCRYQVNLTTLAIRINLFIFISSELHSVTSKFSIKDNKFSSCG